MTRSKVKNGENGDFEKKGDQKTHFGPHGDQSPLKGTNVGAVMKGKFWKNNGENEDKGK